MGATTIPTTMATPVATMVGTMALAMEAGMTATTVAIILATTTAMPQGLLRVPTTSTTTTIPTHTGLARRLAAQVATQPTPAYVIRATSAHSAPTIRVACHSRVVRSTATIPARRNRAVLYSSSVATTAILSVAMTRAPQTRRITPTLEVAVATRLPHAVAKACPKGISISFTLPLLNWITHEHQA